MMNAHVAQHRGFERILAILSAFAVFMSLMVMFAPAALAHHPEISANQTCVAGKVVINYESISWRTDGGSGSGHSDIRIEVRVGGSGSWTQVGSGAYTAGNSYRFSGSFDGEPYSNTSIEVRARAVGAWSNGQGGGESRTTSPFLVNLVCTKSVTVTANPEVCAVNQQGLAQGAVSFNIDPASGASVQVSANSDFTGPVGGALGDDQILNLAPGTYYWQATAGPGFALSGQTSGSFDIDPCEGSVTVNSGVCVVDAKGAPAGSVNVVIDGVSDATVTVYDEELNGVATFSGTGGSSSLPPGSYTWTATPGDGFEFPDGQQTAGQFTINPCEATVIVSHGNCIVGTATALGSVTVVIEPGMAAIVTLLKAGRQVASFNGTGGALALAPGVYTWGAGAAEGFSLSGVTSAGFTVAACDEVLDKVIENDDTETSVPKEDEVLEIVVLPFTGVDTEILLGASIVLLGSGLFLIRSSRRRDES